MTEPWTFNAAKAERFPTISQIRRPVGVCEGFSFALSVLQFRFPNIIGPRSEDICYATTNRQKAVKDIANDVDLMLVIGASNSSNSQRLVEVAKQAGATDAMLIADKDAISWERVNKANHIGLSAGASAPESLVQDVIHALGKRYDLIVTEQGHIRETVNFKLPSILTQ